MTIQDLELAKSFTTVDDVEGYDNSAALNQNEFALHQFIKNGQMEDLYQMIVSLGNRKHDTLNTLASALDNDGLTALHYAALRTSVVAARSLLDNGVYIDTVSKAGETPLHTALRYRNTTVSSLLIKRGASVTAVDPFGNNALHLALENGESEIAAKLLKSNPSLVRCQNNTGFTALHFIAVSGDKKLCGILLAHEGDVTARNVNGETPLHLASLLNHVEVLKLLVKKEHKSKENLTKLLSIPRNDKLTALHIAAKMGHLETVKFMLNIGIDVNPCSGWVPSALELAAGNGHTELMELLLRKGATVDAPDKYMNTALHVAAMKGRTEAVHLLISNGADIDACNEDGWTPLFFAVSKCHIEIIKVLLENGADFNKIDKSLSSCLHYAVEEGCCRAIDLVLQHSEKVLLFQRNTENRLVFHEAIMTNNDRILELLLNRCSGTIIYHDENKTLIHLAAQEGKLFCLKKLIDIWPRDYLDMQDRNERTALHLAAMNGHIDECRLLIESKADLHIRDKDSKKAVELAIERGHNYVLKEFIDANMEMHGEEAISSISNGNVAGHIMLMDYLAYKFVGKKGYRATGLAKMVFESGYPEIVEAVVQHPSFQPSLQFRHIQAEEFMPTLISKYPDVAQKVLDNGITVSNHQIDSPELEVTYDFSALESSPDMSDSIVGCDLYFGPGMMADLGRWQCLAHPLTQKMVNMKWNKHGAFVFYSSLLLYLAFVIMLTTLVILEKNFDVEMAVKTVSSQSKNSTNSTSSCIRCKTESRNAPSQTNSGKIIGGFVFSFALFQILKELLQIIILRRRYFKDPTNLLEWLTYISALGYLNGFTVKKYIDLKVELSFGVTSVFVAWLNVMLFLRRSPLFNIYIVMFTQVTLTLVRVLFVFTPLLLAYALTFNQLFIAQSLFNNVGKSLMKSFVMFSGELEYSDTLPNSIGKTDSASSLLLVYLPIAAYLLFVFFIIMVPVALMNLLVGLAVGDIGSIQKTAEYNVMKQQAQYIQDLNSKCPKFILKWTYKRCHTEKPNQKTWFKRVTSFSTTTQNEYREFIERRQKSHSNKGKKEEEERLNQIQKTLEGQTLAIDALKHQIEQTSRILRDINLR